MHEMRSLDDEEDDDEEPLPLRPGSAFVVVVVDADDVFDADLGVLLLLSPPPPGPSSHSWYVSATARRYHSSVATTSSRKARARRRFFLLLPCFLCCRWSFGEDGSGGDADADDVEKAAFSRGCRLLQPPPAFASAEEEVFIGRRPPFPPSLIFYGELKGKKGRKRERERESKVAPRKSEQFFFFFLFIFLHVFLFVHNAFLCLFQRRVLKKETQFYVMTLGS